MRNDYVPARNDEISEKATSAGAAVTVIPIIGPLPAIGVAGTQMVTDSSIEGASLGLSTAGSTASILWWVCFAKMHRKSEKQRPLP
jgi:hypothetical protein